MKGVSRIGRGIGTGVPTGIVIDPVASFRSLDRTRCRAKFRISRRNSDRIRGRKAGEQRFPAVSRGYFSCFAWKPVIFLTALALRRYLPPPRLFFSSLSFCWKQVSSSKSNYLRTRPYSSLDTTFFFLTLSRPRNFTLFIITSILP